MRIPFQLPQFDVGLSWFKESKKSKNNLLLNDIGFIGSKGAILGETTKKITQYEHVLLILQKIYILESGDLHLGCHNKFHDLSCPSQTAHSWQGFVNRDPLKM